MLQALVILMIFQPIGEGIRTAIQLMFPGPLFGMILMVSWLTFRGGVPENIGAVSAMVVGNLGLFFVPAGAGIIAFPAVLFSNGIAIVVSLIASTCLPIIAGGIGE